MVATFLSSTLTGQWKIEFIIFEALSYLKSFRLSYYTDMFELEHDNASLTDTGFHWPVCVLQAGKVSVCALIRQGVRQGIFVLLQLPAVLIILARPVFSLSFS